MNHTRLITAMGSIIGFLLITAVSMIAWIALQVWDMNPKVTETARRVDRIVDVLPDVRIRIAHEDLGKKIRFVLLTTEPTQKPDGSWVTAVHDIDFSSGKQSTFAVPLKKQDDPTASYMVQGIANSVAREKTSFEDYGLISMSVGKVTRIPTYIDAPSSFAVTKSSLDSDARIAKLSVIFGQPVRLTSIKKEIVKWDEFADKLGKDESMSNDVLW